MKFRTLVSATTFKRTLMSAALAAACVSAQALPVFTFTPPAVGLVGAPVTADNLLLSNFSTLLYTSPTNFTRQGFLSITGFQLGGSNLVALGLNSTYSLYLSFIGTGQLTLGTASTDPRTSVMAGVFDTFTYSLIGANGNSSFGFAGNTPTVTSTGMQTLASGSLINGNIVSTPANGGADFVPSVATTLSFNVAPGKSAFFSPIDFYNVAFSAITNSASTVEPINSGTGVGSGYRINNGGGNLNFAERSVQVAEPGALGLMFAGLGAVGFLARRRKGAAKAA